MNWLRYYQYRVYSIQEDERPPESIIPYDLLLDDWIEAQDRRKEQEAKKAKKESYKFRTAGK